MIGARLKQARMLAGLTQKELVDRLDKQGFAITKQAISKYETGKGYPPVRFLLLASTALGVRSTYFSVQPAESVKWKAFRRHSDFGKRKQEAIKAHAADIAELQVELHSLLYPGETPDFPQAVPTKTIEDVEWLAGHLRKKWEWGNRPLDNLVQTTEDRGAIVIGWEDERGKFDGLSGWCSEYPVTVINTNRSADRIRFNLAHEIGHLVMDTSEVPEDEEKLAHRFAAALLVPADHAFHELGRKRHHLDWNELLTLKRKYGLSMAAWVRRARDLKIISEHSYQKLCVELSTRGWRKDEPGEYLGDEEPIQLKQMASRAVAEGLMSPDRITSVCPDCLDSAIEEKESGHLTVRDLLKMPEQQRNAVMERAFALAAEDEFERFEANEYYEIEDISDEA